MKLKIAIIAFATLLVFPFYAGIGFSFKKVWQKVSSVPGSIGNIVAKGTGTAGFVEGSFEPAINKLEQANSRSIHLLDDKLNTRLNQFNNILKAREEQLDEVFKTSIYLMDEGIKENINKIDEALKTRIGQLNSGLMTVSYAFSSALWTVFRGTATIFLVLMTVYLTQEFIANYRKNVRQHLTAENDSIKSKFKIRIAVIVIGFIFILFFQPSIFKHFQNPELVKQIQAVEHNLYASARNLNYDECIYNASLLTTYEIENPKYQYYLAKYTILREFIYRPKLALFSLNNIQKLQLNLSDLEEYKTEIEKKDSKFKDNDFDIINALFFSNVLNSRRGDLIAAFLSMSSLSPEIDSPLKPLAIDFISNYLLNPFDDKTAKEILIEDGFITSEDNLPDFYKIAKIDCNYFTESPLCINYNYNELVRQLQRDDEQDFLDFINSSDWSSQEKISKNMAIRWVNAIKTIEEMSRISNNISANMITLNDSYVNYVSNKLRQNNNNSYDSIYKELVITTSTILPETIPSANSSDIETNEYNQVRTDFTRLPDIRKYIASNFLVKFNFLSRMPFLVRELNKQSYQTESLESLIRAHQAYQIQQQPEIRLGAADTENFKIYAAYARELSKQGLHNKISKKPLAIEIYEKMLQDIPRTASELKEEYIRLGNELSENLNSKRYSHI